MYQNWLLISTFICISLLDCFSCSSQYYVLTVCSQSSDHHYRQYDSVQKSSVPFSKTCLLQWPLDLRRLPQLPMSLCQCHLLHFRVYYTVQVLQSVLRPRHRVHYPLLHQRTAHSGVAYNELFVFIVPATGSETPMFNGPSQFRPKITRAVSHFCPSPVPYWGPTKKRNLQQNLDTRPFHMRYISLLLELDRYISFDTGRFCYRLPGMRENTCDDFCLSTLS